MGKNKYYVDESKPWFQTSSNWPSEVPKNCDFPLKSMGTLFMESVEKFGNARAVWFLNDWITYNDLKRYVLSLATVLSQSGISKGDCVALLLPNSPQYIIGYYACQMIGAIPSGINPSYKPLEALHQLQITNARALICLDALYEPIIAPILKNTNIKRVIASSIVDFKGLSPLKKFIAGKILKKFPTGKIPRDALRLTDVFNTPIHLPDVNINPEEDVATYIMTGGTTGVPKAAVLTHFNLVSNCIQTSLWLFKAQPGTSAIAIIPFFHSFAMTAVMNLSMMMGMWILCFPKPPAVKDLCEKIQNVIPEGGPALFPGAEILFKRLADYEDIAKYNLSGKLGLCVAGAGPLHRPVQEKFEKITGAKLCEGYGLTEASPVVSAGPFYVTDRKIGTIGLPFPGTEWKIVDKNDPTREMGIGEDQIGEVIVSGPQVMKGYLNQPEETADHIKDLYGKKYLLTGDIGYMDKDGYIYLLDRKKQLIKHKGYSVFPKEVEELVGRHHKVSEVAVAGLPDEETGEVIKAWVVLNHDAKGTISENELLEWCRNNMAHYKAPTYIEFRDDLPKTLVGKVLRRVLQEEDPLFKNKVSGRI